MDELMIISSKMEVEQSELSDLIEKGLSGYLYDIAVIIYKMYADKYVCARIKSRMWYVFDGMMWIENEMGPYREISTHIVSLYEDYLCKVQTKYNALLIPALDLNNDEVSKYLYQVNKNKLYNKIDSINDLICKLKSVHYKESLCKECCYLFSNTEFLKKLDTIDNCIVFKNGIYNKINKTFREMEKEDYISVTICEEYDPSMLDDELEKYYNIYIEKRNKVLKKRNV